MTQSKIFVPWKETFEAFWYWINERHSIYCKREQGGRWPWTTDPILQEYRFCNVFRELDTVTVAFKKMLREPLADHPDLWFWYCVARQINWPATVEEILVDCLASKGGWDPDIAYASLRQRQARGEKLYTGAYMLRGDIQNGNEDNNKPKYTVYKVLQPVWYAYQTLGPIERSNVWSSIESATNWLESFSGWGGFLAYEVATDLRHTKFLQNVPDVMTWANPGPGAKRGLNRIFNRPLNQALPRERALEEMRWLLSESIAHTGKHVPPMELRDIEHSLCETDKMLRVKNGEGRPRAKYKPSKERVTC